MWAKSTAKSIGQKKINIFINQKITIMEIRTKYAIGQSVVTSEGQQGEVIGFYAKLNDVGQVSLTYEVETEEGPDEYIEQDLTGQQGEYTIKTKYSLGQEVYYASDTVDKGTIKEIAFAFKQEEPEIMYFMGLRYSLTFLEDDFNVFTEDEKDKLVDYITKNID